MPDVLTSLAIERFRADPEMQPYNTSDEAVAGCFETAHRFAWHCHLVGVPCRILRWKNLERMQTARTHNCLVNGLVVDWTHQQIDATAEWPHIQPVDEYEAIGFKREWHLLCGRCGAPSDIHPSCTGILYDPLDAIEIWDGISDYLADLRARVQAARASQAA